MSEKIECLNCKVVKEDKEEIYMYWHTISINPAWCEKDFQPWVHEFCSNDCMRAYYENDKPKKVGA